MNSEFKEYFMYLLQHIEYEHIYLDIRNKYKKRNLRELTLEEIKELAILYKWSNQE